VQVKVVLAAPPIGVHQSQRVLAVSKLDAGFGRQALLTVLAHSTLRPCPCPTIHQHRPPSLQKLPINCGFDSSQGHFSRSTFATIWPNYCSFLLPGAYWYLVRAPSPRSAHLDSSRSLPSAPLPTTPLLKESPSLLWNSGSPAAGPGCQPRGTSNAAKRGSRRASCRTTAVLPLSTLTPRLSGSLVSNLSSAPLLGCVSSPLLHLHPSHRLRSYTLVVCLRPILPS